MFANRKVVKLLSELVDALNSCNEQLKYISDSILVDKKFMRERNSSAIICDKVEPVMTMDELLEIESFDRNSVEKEQEKKNKK